MSTNVVANSGLVRKTYCHSSSNRDRSCCRREMSEAEGDEAPCADEWGGNRSTTKQRRMTQPGISRAERVMNSPSRRRFPPPLQYANNPSDDAAFKEKSQFYALFLSTFQ